MVGTLHKLRRSQEARVLGLFFVLCCLLWGAANWPGLREPWWYTDDFPFALTMQRRPDRAFAHALGGGRPLQIPWFYTQLLDGTPDRVGANIALRALGGLLHALSTTLAAGLLWQATGRRAALAGALPFLLWPFSGEVVLWRTAAYYCLASSISLAGAYLLLPATGSRLKRAVGVACIAGSMLTHQIAGLAGLVVGVLYVALVQMRRVGSTRDPVVRRASLLSLGYLLGGFASLAVARLAPMARAEVPLVLMDKLTFLLELNKLFLAPDQFPWWLVTMQTALVVGPVLLLLAQGGSCLATQRKWLAVAMVLAAVVTPYATLMLVGES